LNSMNHYLTFNKDKKCNVHVHAHVDENEKL
jgi:hypothetical protein